MQERDRTTQSVNPFHNARVAIVGIGVTGRSCARFLLMKNADITVFDQKPISAEELQTLSSMLDVARPNAAALNNITICSHILDDKTDLNAFDFVVLSPGISASLKAIEGIQNRERIISDLDIFAQFNITPCIGVTGSNGKSTVVDLLKRGLEASGLRVQMGGNFGIGALDLLGHDADYIVLELSSFQLEITQKLPLEVACILNITEDHIDRHHSFKAYACAKHRIFEHATQIVYNREDDVTIPLKSKGKAVRYSYAASISSKVPTDQRALAEHDFWQDSQGIHCQTNLLVPSASIKIPLAHMMLNMQFVLAIVSSLKLPLQGSIEQCQQYEGLPHRFEFVAQHGHVRYINDSKATNPGACMAAIQSARQLQMNTILIAGGDAKGADLSVLEEGLNAWVKWCIVYGKDAELFARIGKHVVCVANLDEAIKEARRKASQFKDETLILLSPACASIDMFNSYVERGDAFKKAVLGEAA